MTTVQSLDDLFVNELLRAHAIETKLAEELPQLADDAGVDALDENREFELRDELIEAIEQHQAQTQSHVERVETALEAMDRTPAERSTPALDGFVQLKSMFNNLVLNDQLRPMFYVDAARQIEQLEIVLYRRLVDIAEHLDLPAGATDPLEETLREEEAMLETLDELRESGGFDDLVTAVSTDPSTH